MLITHVRVFSDPRAMGREIANRFCQGAGLAAKAKNIFSVVLSGGSTASKVYREAALLLRGKKILWERVHIFWADERCVLPDSVESNYQTISRSFLNDVPIPYNNVHRIKGEEDPETESIRYAQEIRDHLMLRNNKDVFFDWVLLGVGVDGHTASLFPGGDLFQSRNICEVVRHPQTGQSRVTLTPMAIERSNRITYHVIGREKARIVSKLASPSPPGYEDYPAAQIPGEWFLDREAASNLRLGEKL